jgi:hypothetical protein
MTLQFMRPSEQVTLQFDNMITSAVFLDKGEPLTPHGTQVFV